MNTQTPSKRTLTDDFGRRVKYVRLSLTDRCDFRCVYCMSEDMTFLPRKDILSLEELLALGKAFADLGVEQIRLTGGEPLVRRDMLWLVEQLAKLPIELTLTTNGSQLATMAPQLKAAGLSRINVSLDTLDEGRFAELTRTGRLSQVLAGLEVASQQGFDAIKLNAVIMKGRNDHEVGELVAYACKQGFDISFIEEMPLGHIEEHDRQLAFCSSDEIRERLSEQFTLQESGYATGGPSRYYQVQGEQTRVGFISPHSHNFCDQCNRVRVTAEGRLLLCLGNEHSMDLRQVLRAPDYQPEHLEQALMQAMHLKPERHWFDDPEAPQVIRFMNMTGG